MGGVYQTDDRGGLLGMGIAFMAGGGLFMLIAASVILGRIGLRDADESTSAGAVAGALFMGGFGALVAFVGWHELRHSTYELRLTPDGTVEAVQVLGTTRVRADDIRVIEKTITKAKDDDGETRTIHIRHTHGTMHLSDFPDANRFISDVTAVHPGIEVRGRW